MKHSRFILLLAPILLTISSTTILKAQFTPESIPPDEQCVARWQAARFGMFIHWGPVSLRGTEIGWSRGREVPIEEYDRLYQQFNPTRFNADEWVLLAKEAGMKYMIITSKHHDGFCIYDSQYTDYDIMSTPFHRDILRELSDACRRHGLAFGTYYSVLDWYHPDYSLGSPGGKTAKPNPDMDSYEQYLLNQTREIAKKYGPLWTFWFDGHWEEPWPVERGWRLFQHCRNLDPHIMVNNRVSKPWPVKTGSPVSSGDYDTPEQRIGTFNNTRPWETCMTLCTQWAWKPDDRMKSLKQCLQTLIRTVGGDGNLLFNVGPMPDGRIEPRQAERLREMGQWLHRNGESIYGTRGGPYKPGNWGVATHKGNIIYLHVLSWSGETINLPPIPKIIQTASLFPDETPVHFAQTHNGIALTVPKSKQSEIDTIIAVKLDGPATQIDPVQIPSLSLAFGKPAVSSNSFMNQPAYGPDKAFDDDNSTRWATDVGTHSAWLAVDLGGSFPITRAIIKEAFPGRVKKYRLEYKKSENEESWNVFHEGTTLGENAMISFKPVVVRHVRLHILEAVEGPTIWEFQLLRSTKANR
ncbi:MAG: alpha-L-fucosidase [Sedimentisphaerales bacterium]|nr:alpha-L-fucosidase [Sedimentisphaerales bacterium]